MSPLDRVYTFEDLHRWDNPGVSLAVLGQPIAHSLSPLMHHAALQHLARSTPRWRDWNYFRFEINPADLPKALAAFHQKKFRGLNLTIPHKVVAFPLVRDVDAEARPIAAVNTLLWMPAGWMGFNTDGYGFSQAVRQALGYELAGQNILLLGAGGAARAAAVECLRRNCAALTIANRTAEKIVELQSSLASLAGKIPVRAFDPAAAHAPHLVNALVINATSLGLKPDDPVSFDLHQLSRPLAVFDMIYNPPKTTLLETAEKLGVPCANGLPMLVHQGAKALELWTGTPAAETAPAMSAALTEKLHRSAGASRG